MPPIKFDIFFDEVSLAIFFFVVVGFIIMITIYLNFLHVLNTQDKLAMSDLHFQIQNFLIKFKKNN